MKRSFFNPTLFFCCAALGGLCLVQTGCSILKPKADNTQLYVLRAQPGTPVSADKDTATRPLVRVGPGRLAAYLDVTPVVVQDGPNRLKQLDAHHWAEPLPKGIGRVLGENLAQRLNGAQMIIYPEPANGATLEVRYAVNRLEGPLGRPVVLQVNWQLVDLTSGEVLRAASTNREIAAAKNTADVSAYVEQLCEAVGAWADEVAGAIRSLPANRQP